MFNNSLYEKRWKRFRSNKMAIFCGVGLLIFCFFSITAEFWANSKPLILKYRGTTYFPVVKTYHPTLFGKTEFLVMDYRILDMGTDDWAFWPIVKWDPYESNQDVDTYPSPPTKRNWMGTDDSGRDVLTRLLYGFRYSFTYAIAVWAITSILGIMSGGLMGYFGGTVDLFGQRAVEVFVSTPQFFLLLILVSIFMPNLSILIMISCVFGWVTTSTYIRGEFLKNRKREFVEAAKAIGASHRRIVFKHILPNSLGPILTFSPFVIAGLVTSLAALDYLGFGLAPPTPSWGELLSQAQKNFTIAWWLALYPSALLCCSLILLAMVGEGILEAMNPRKYMKFE